MNILALIPAQGRLERRPPQKTSSYWPASLSSLIRFREARKSKYINRIIVSTEDDEIAQIARELGAEVPFVQSPVELALDDVLDLPVFQHCLRWLQENEGYTPDLVVHLRPTAPLRTVSHIDGAMNSLLHLPERTPCGPCVL